MKEQINYKLLLGVFVLALLSSIGRANNATIRSGVLGMCAAAVSNQNPQTTNGMGTNTGAIPPGGTLGPLPNCTDGVQGQGVYSCRFDPGIGTLYCNDIAGAFTTVVDLFCFTVHLGNKFWQVEGDSTGKKIDGEWVKDRFCQKSFAEGIAGEIVDIQGFEIWWSDWWTNLRNQGFPNATKINCL